MDEDTDKKPSRSVPWWLVAVVGVVAALTLSQFVRGSSGGGVEEVSLRTFALEVEVGQAERLTVKGDKLTLEQADGSKIESRKEESTSALETLQQLGVTQAALQEIEIEIEKEGTGFGTILAIILALRPSCSSCSLEYSSFARCETRAADCSTLVRARPGLRA